MMRSPTAAALLALSLPVLVPDAWAQPAPPPTQPGPAAPSSAARPGLGTQILDLPPTEALFDAVNRGDIAAARDAVSRGADLQGRNLLGETPTELAVSLGRTEIAFFLLSLRRTGRAEPPPALAPAPTATPSAPRGRNASPRGREAAVPVPVPAGPPPRARLWAGDGGSPVPEAGFLGFDAGRPAPRS